jgi:ferredoxin--NADP+ reductase/benzoate/toluate 1,2-dioxygenase reductase subunit
MSMVKTKNNIVSVLSTRHLTNSAYVVRLERDGLDFEAGQYISLGLPGTADKREYSIYSGMNDDYLEVLVKEIDGGVVSRQLKQLNPGSKAEMDGPFGFFTLGLEQQAGGKLVFIASGTGIAPFRSYIRSYPALDYKIIHGVRYGDEAYDARTYDTGRYLLCTSRDNRGIFKGRVTDYLEKTSPDPKAHYYLCGNSNMIHDAYDILKEKGLDAGRIHAEVYF